MAARIARGSRHKQGAAPEEPQARIEQVGKAANTWIVGDDEEVIVVDPGQNAAAVLDAVGERQIAAVICTHGHAGRVAAAVEVAARDEAPVALHTADRGLWRDEHSEQDPDIDMEDGGIFGVANVTLEVMHTPGHTPGSVCLYCEDLDAVFTGDALAAGGPVAHDGEFPDFSRQLSSIGEHLLTLPGRTRVLPGHGDELTISRAEKRFDAWVAAGPSLLTSPPEEYDEDEDEPEDEDELEEGDDLDEDEDEDFEDDDEDFDDEDFEDDDEDFDDEDEDDEDGDDDDEEE